MKALFEFFLKYFDFLYLNPQYRIADSHVAKDAPSASLTLVGPALTFALIYDRGQIEILVAPSKLTQPENWFWPSLIKQYIDNDRLIHYLPAPDEAIWVRENLGAVERLLSGASTLKATCDELCALRRADSEKYWSSWREEQGLT
ncbi:hypothetical protein [Mycobacterium scrofulaceum]|uniref:hypothetical protein n=1 Tax=Mycobacterium scrofulaceum TaxID=1783 RepID=UPI000B281BCA|nr:hypothetical protein [Mycobacterium scrofulaceum]